MKRGLYILLVLLLIGTVFAQYPSRDYVVKNQWYEAVFDETGIATVNAVFNVFNKGFDGKSLEFGVCGSCGSSRSN